MNKLKPCPFCGGKAETFKRSQSPGYDEAFIIGCETCRGRINPFYTRREAIAAWNRRSGGEDDSGRNGKLSKKEKPRPAMKKNCRQRELF